VDEKIENKTWGRTKNKRVVGPKDTRKQVKQKGRKINEQGKQT
jgi:hypothetical protein